MSLRCALAAALLALAGCGGSAAPQGAPGAAGTEAPSQLPPPSDPVSAVLATPPMSRAALEAHVAFLCDEGLAGRLAGSEGERLAGEYLADSFPFERAGVPALFFTSSVSDDYHRPSDRPDTLKPELMVRRGRALAELVVALSKLPRSDLPRSTGSPFHPPPSP